MCRFTEKELAIAKTADLTAVATSLGYTVKRVGRYYTLKEMDSIRIYDKSNWFRWSKRNEKGENGGSQIDFLRVFQGMEVKDAVFWLLDFTGYRRTKDTSENDFTSSTNQDFSNKLQIAEEVKKSFVLPQEQGNSEVLIRYLHKERGISLEVIYFFLEQGLIYESKPYHNIVFKGTDRAGDTRFASMRGTNDANGRSFKCDVTGNDKRYGFNIANEKSEELIVFEAAIDLMSYIDLYSDYTTNKIALGMLGDAPIQTFITEYPQIRSISFCLDNDGPGRDASFLLEEKYKKQGFVIKGCPAPKEYKDYNEYLLATRRFIDVEKGNRIKNIGSGMKISY